MTGQRPGFLSPPVRLSGHPLWSGWGLPTPANTLDLESLQQTLWKHPPGQPTAQGLCLHRWMGKHHGTERCVTPHGRAPRRGWESQRPTQLSGEDSWRSWHFQREEHTTSDGRGSLTTRSRGHGGLWPVR